jgi:hypothetical protein
MYFWKLLPISLPAQGLPSLLKTFLAHISSNTIFSHSADDHQLTFTPHANLTKPDSYISSTAFTIQRPWTYMAFTVVIQFDDVSSLSDLWDGKIGVGV